MGIGIFITFLLKVLLNHYQSVIRSCPHKVYHFQIIFKDMQISVETTKKLKNSIGVFFLKSVSSDELELCEHIAIVGIKHNSIGLVITFNSRETNSVDVAFSWKKQA